MSDTVASEGMALLEELGISGTARGACWGEWLDTSGNGEVSVTTPADGSELGRVNLCSVDDYETVLGKCRERFETWRMVPAPQRGEVIRQLGEEFRKHKKALGALIAWEMGKIRSEGEGEVQEVIDDFVPALEKNRRHWHF